MKFVKLTQDVRSRHAGEVLRLDDASAASLVEKKQVATYFDPATDTVDAVRTAPRLGNGTIVQVADADIPQPAGAVEAPLGEFAEIPPGDGSGEKLPDAPSAADPKPELVARLVAATVNTDEPITEEEAEKLTRVEIVDKLTMLPLTAP